MREIKFRGYPIHNNPELLRGMMKITISDLTNDGTVISTCDLFIENEHGTIANLKTDKSYLRHGFAKKVMTTAVKVANGLRLKSISLRVLKNSFMREWYIRLGYKYFAEDTENENYEWLKKYI